MNIPFCSVVLEATIHFRDFSCFDMKLLNLWLNKFFVIALKLFKSVMNTNYAGKSTSISYYDLDDGIIDAQVERCMFHCLNHQK